MERFSFQFDSLFTLFKLIKNPTNLLEANFHFLQICPFFRSSKYAGGLTLFTGWKNVSNDSMKRSEQATRKIRGA